MLIVMLRVSLCSVGARPTCTSERASVVPFHYHNRSGILEVALAVWNVYTLANGVSARFDCIQSCWALAIGDE
jgi:hypothetical protein